MRLFDLVTHLILILMAMALFIAIQHFREGMFSLLDLFLFFFGIIKGTTFIIPKEKYF